MCLFLKAQVNKHIKDMQKYIKDTNSSILFTSIVVGIVSLYGFFFSITVCCMDGNLHKDMDFLKFAGCF